MKLESGKVLTACPHCGCESYRVRVRIYGSANYNYRFDGEFDDNSELHTYLHYVERKLAYCNGCRKFIGRVQEHTPFGRG